MGTILSWGPPFYVRVHDLDLSTAALLFGGIVGIGGGIGSLEQLDKLAAACVEPKLAVELLPLMFRRELKGLHLVLAMGEALAHLEYLVHVGRLHREQGDGRVSYINP